MFGYPDIETIIGASARLPLIARRQIMATRGFPQIGQDRAITIRLATGLTSRAVGLLASAVTMPDGESAIMLAVPAAQTGSRSAAEIAGRAISGFTEDGHFIAFVDATGKIEAASDGFAALGILPETLAALVADVATESDRIVKRLVPGGTASYPAGLARLTEARHLLVVIDEDQLEDEPSIDDSAGETAGGAVAARNDVMGRPQAHPNSANAAAADATTDQATASKVIEHIARQSDHAVDSTAQTPEAADSDRLAAGGTPAQHDHWYFNAGGDDAQPADGPAKAAQAKTLGGPNVSAEGLKQDVAQVALATELASPPPIDRSAPLRFVWRTDAQGKFSALSPEFVEIVGKPAADVIGRRFKDVAATFGLDASGEIAGLLERRDTWSGRSVLWPVAGTDLKIPVDLAALPVYSRRPCL